MKSSSGYEIYHNTLSSCLDEIEDYVKSKGYQIGDYFPLVNHVHYGKTERTELEMLKDGKEVNTLKIQIYRMDSGRYELNCYPVRKFSGGGGVKSYYIVTFGFNGEDGEYEVHDSKPILAENEQEAGSLLRDDFWAYEGIKPDIMTITKAYKTGGKILWAVKKGEPDYNEQIITENEERIEDAKKWATENGFDRFRIQVLDLSTPPDFKKTFGTGGSIEEQNYAMIKSDNKAILHHSTELSDILKSKKKIPSWTLALVNQSSQNLSNVTHYLDGEEQFKTGGYTRPAYDLKTTGDYLFHTIKGQFSITSYLFERQNDTEDALEIQDELRGELGSIIIKNSAWKNLASGKSVKARTSKGNLVGTLKRIDGGKKFSGGGSTDDGIDLFEDYENIPPQVQTILDKYAEGIEDGDYNSLGDAKNELEEIGYTFDYYVDGTAYDLRPIGSKGKVPDDEKFSVGGGLKTFKVGDHYLYKFDNKVYEVLGIGERQIALCPMPITSYWNNRLVTLTLMQKWVKNKMMIKQK